MAEGAVNIAGAAVVGGGGAEEGGVEGRLVLNLVLIGLNILPLVRQTTIFLFLFYYTYEFAIILKLEPVPPSVAGWTHLPILFPFIIKRVRNERSCVVVIASISLLLQVVFTLRKMGIIKLILI